METGESGLPWLNVRAHVEEDVVIETDYVTIHLQWTVVSIVYYQTTVEDGKNENRRMKYATQNHAQVNEMEWIILRVYLHLEYS